MSIKADLKNQIAYCNEKLAEKGVQQTAIGVKGVGDLIGTIEGGGMLPSIIDKIDAGTYTPLENTTTSPVVQHNLGVIPDFVFVYTDDLAHLYADVDVSTSMGMFIRGLKQYNTLSVQYDDFFISNKNVANQINTNSTLTPTITADRFRVYPTETELTFIKYDNSTYFKKDTLYKWIAIKFKGVV